LNVEVFLLMHIVRRSRLLLDMDQWSLGEAIGKSASWVSLLEHGRVKPDLATAAKLARTLGIDLAELQDALEGAEHD